MHLPKETINIQQLYAMFDGDFSLDEVLLVSMLLFSGPSLRLAFEQLNMPNTIPAKWKLKKYNAFSFCLEFINIKKIMINHWEPLLKCSPNIIYKNEVFSLKIDKGNKNIIYCDSEFLSLHDVNGYVDNNVL